MAAATASPHRPREHGLTAGDWPDEHLSPRRRSVGGGHAHLREQGLDTGVRVMGLYSTPCMDTYDVTVSNDQKMMDDWISSFANISPGFST